MPVDTIRVWERRYRTVVPGRNEQNKRRYTHADIVRLTLIKQLVNLGHAVSTVASLRDSELRARLSLHEQTAAPPKTLAPRKVLLYGPTLPHLLQIQGAAFRAIEVIGSSEDFAKFKQDALNLKPEFLVLEFPALNAKHIDEVLALKAQIAPTQVVVVYAYGTTDNVRRLVSMDVAALRTPVTAEMLQETLAPTYDADGMRLRHALPRRESVSGDPPPRKYDDRALAALTNVATAINCECPHHLSDLLMRLNAFEAYSADCEKRNREDASLHAFLHRRTAHARALVEEAVDYIIRAEQIDLPLPET